MSEDWSGSESLLQEVESGAAIVSEFPRSVFGGKLHERNDDVGVVMDKVMVEVHESEEGLNALNFPWFQPIRNGLNFLCGHRESIRRKAETKVLSGGGMELTFLWIGKEIVLAEVSEDFVDMFLMGLEVLGVYEDVIQIDNNRDIEEVCKDTIDESLKGCRGIGQAKGHDIPFEGPILHAEHGLPFISFSNADQMVHMAKINLSVDLSLARGVEEI